MSKHKFKNDKERIAELKFALEEIKRICYTEKDVETISRTVGTLSKDVLSRYDKDMKFVTADIPTIKL